MPTESGRLAPGSPRRCVVTGDGGFIGRRLCERLRSDGSTVRGISRTSGVDILTDPLDFAGQDHVFHLAGLTFVPDAWAEPARFHLVNAHGTARVAEGM